MKTTTTAEFNEMEPSEKLDLFLEQKRMHHFEGSTGVRNLETLFRSLGYGYGGKGDFVGDHPIHNFLSDNPGAMEALIEFVREHIDEEQVEELDINLAVADTE